MQNTSSLKGSILYPIIATKLYTNIEESLLYFYKESKYEINAAVRNKFAKLVCNTFSCLFSNSLA